MLSANNGIQTSGSVINNIAGNNSILGGIFRTTGAGDTTITSSDGSLTLAGSITSNSVRKLTLTGSSTGANTVSGAIQDGGNSTANPNPLTKDGAGTWTLAGINTYSGDTTVNAGTLVLANGGSQKFYPKTTGTSNKITDSDTTVETGGGQGTLTLNGALAIDLTNATTATEWLLVDVANLAETYGTNFTVTDFTETPIDSGIWKRTVDGNTYTFTESRRQTDPRNRHQHLCELACRQRTRHGFRHRL